MHSSQIEEVVEIEWFAARAVLVLFLFALPGPIAWLRSVASLETLERIVWLERIVRVGGVRLRRVERFVRVHQSRESCMRCAMRVCVTVVGLASVFMVQPIRAAEPLELRAAAPLRAIIESYLQIQNQLISDKTDGVKAAATEIAKQAGSMGAGGAAIAKAAASVAAAADLKATRQAFGPLSDAVIAAAASDPALSKELGVKVAFCPMVNRSWLQKEDKVRNPYYGTAMLECGEIKK